MPHISHSEDFTKHLHLDDVDNNSGTCTKCNATVSIRDWGNHVCINNADKVDKSPIQEDHNYGSVLDEDNDQNMITIPATLLTDVMAQQQKLTDVTTEHNANTLIAKLYECVASHYENGDRTGAEAILNSIAYAQQELK